MKKKSGKTVFNTEIDVILKKTTVGSYGDPTGYEETLFMTENKVYYVYSNGGKNSPFTKEKITKVSEDKVKEIMNYTMV